MELTQVIKKPVLTEKSNNLQAQNTYTFVVEYSANKYQIKQAVEHIFQVKVESVNTLKYDKKFKRVGRYEGYLNRYKKAVVTLKEGSVINYYPNEAEAQDEAKKEAKAQKVAQDKAQNKAKEAQLADKIAAKKAKAANNKATNAAKKPVTRSKKEA
ncbi:50S ribosomal protein L23 [Mycoplasmopsis columbina]|uniref:Large ribosomal subunit protein uL23 n=1 Tax=Mycoplasmopsis columbina SF7 TaxID=1037410 RepID=F9UJL4_9BACT|nr:50S ribosomal protein L23 [Mycoplasmopsis columbina]EGV00395.1 putative 50S ribosomal protein l23 [Mycoplasmopsis columbina SF7]VEU76740.1 50S ribosomal protein L23 [Mycoplasmopsis columbina]